MSDWQAYTPALDRDALTTAVPALARLDLQLLAKIDAAAARLREQGFEVRERVQLQGFSASGMFANRFTLLHPERVLACAAGSPGGWPVAPAAEHDGERLPYPAGVADLEGLTGRAFDQAAFAAVPQLHVLGALDDNDSLDVRDGWDEEPATLVERLFGATPVERFDDAEALYAAAGVDARFLLVEGAGHDRRGLQHHTTDFFREVLAR
jgi:pimeloyl-ACP methyl ester carboxylesterase